MKGIILAGGSGTRLYPMTLGVCKQLLPVYNKPMIYYPLSALMLAGIRDVLIISTSTELPRFRKILGDGSQIGMNFSYADQERPRGLADAFRIGREFIGADDVCLILGDNIFYGHGLPEMLRKAVADVETRGGATIFAYKVRDPQRYGVVEFDRHGKVLSLEEKPSLPKSDYAITGLYFCDNHAVKIAEDLAPSARGELEIIDVINSYLKAGKLRVETLGTGFAWLDTGTPRSLLDAGEYVGIIQEREGVEIAAIEELALKLGYIDSEQLSTIAKQFDKSDYGKYLLKIAEGK